MSTVIPGIKNESINGHFTAFAKEIKFNVVFAFYSLNLYTKEAVQFLIPSL